MCMDSLQQLNDGFADLMSKGTHFAHFGFTNWKKMDLTSIPSTVNLRNRER